MIVVVRSPQGEADVAVERHDLDATLGDLVTSVTGQAVPALLHVDGRPVASTTPVAMAGVVDGSTLDVTPTLPAPDGVVELVVVGGPGTGRARPLGPGRYRLGPGASLVGAELAPGTDLESRAEIAVDDHARVTVRAPGAHLDGVPVDGERPWAHEVLVFADRAYALRRGRGNLDRPPLPGTGSGAVAFNRPPRSPAPADAPPIVVPGAGREGGPGRRFPLLGIVAPIPVAVAMAVLLGNPRFMLFGLLSPVMVIANWSEDRRGRRRDDRRRRSADRAAAAAFERQLDDAIAAETTRRRVAHPALDEVIRWARLADPELWHRRLDDPAALVLSIGVGDVAWHPPLERDQQSIDVTGALDERGTLPAVAVTADLRNERGVGIVGPGAHARAVARALVLQAVTLHGPADVDVLVCTTTDRAAAWEWAKWLPHLRAGRTPRILTDERDVRAWADAVREQTPRGPRPVAAGHYTLCVVDHPGWWHERGAPLRAVLADAATAVRFVALAEQSEHVPAVCTTVVALDASAGCTVHHLLRRTSQRVVPALADSETSAAAARFLAPFEDSELPVAVDTSLPEHVGVLRLLGLDEPSPVTIRQRWAASGDRPVATVGQSAHGPLTLDLVADGPHGLIAGTTGAGKSELLRSLVIALAASAQPDDVNFVLVDFKGGSAFDACAELAHTVGMVTDLDDHLAGRILRCLRAELVHRERVLRDAGVSSIEEYRASSKRAPLPRLVLVVDEFASLAAELPTFLPALVDIAQRGRSLGLHMILATQRPAGVLDNKIKANTNLRIALRVQDDGDSIDVIGTRDAAGIARRFPGRALARFGAGELTMFQSALATGVSAADGAGALTVEPFVVGRRLSRLEQRLRQPLAPSMPATGTPRTSDLELLVHAINGAAADLGQSEQRRPYLDPLPSALTLADLAPVEQGVPYALVDLPDEQRQEVKTWTPGPDGGLLVYGIAGAGTSTTLATLAIAAARQSSADDLHLYVIDADANLLAPLAGLPHCGAVVRPDDPERLARLVRVLGREYARRQRLAAERGGPAAVAASEPVVVLLVDNVGALRQFLDDQRELAAVWPELERVIRDGRAVGMCAVLGSASERGVPTSLSTQISDKLLLRLADKVSYTAFGFRPADVPDFVPGRALNVADHTEIQIARPDGALADVVARVASRTPPAVRLPHRVESLPARVALGDIVHLAGRGETHVAVAIGLDTHEVEPALLRLELGGSAIVTGPPRSGRSSVLAAIAAGVHRSDPDIAIHAVGPRSSGPLDELAPILTRPAGPADVADWVQRILDGEGLRLVLIDDADRLGGPSFEKLAAARDDRLIVVFAGRADELRGISQWTKPLQRTRTGVLLRPVPTDGDLLRVQLPPRLPVFDVGRGFAVNDGALVPLLAATAAGAQ